MHPRRTAFTLRHAAALVALAAIASAAPARAQESVPATHLVRLDIVDPLPGAGVVTGVAIIAADQATSMIHIRIAVAVKDDRPDSIFLRRRDPGRPAVTLFSGPYPSGTSSPVVALPIYNAAFAGLIDSERVWVDISRASDHAVWASGPIIAVVSAVTPEPSGDQVVPPVTGTSAVANCSFTYDPVANVLHYSAWWLDLESDVNAVHVNRAAVGVNGPTVIEMPVSAGSAEIFGTVPSPSSALLFDLAVGNLYFEITTVKHPSGHIRGQIYPVETYTAAILPSNEVPAVTGSNAGGTAFLIITAPGTNEVFNKLQGIVVGLSGPMIAAHIHRGPIGVSGPPIVPLDFFNPSTLDLELAAGSAGGPLPNDALESIRAMGAYVNVHTSAHENGEARGQLIPARGILPKESGVTTTPDAAANAVTAIYHPASESIVVGAGAHAGRAVLYDASGRALRTVAYDGARAEIAARDIPVGVYFVALLDGTRTTATARVLVVR